MGYLSFDYQFTTTTRNLTITVGDDVLGSLDATEEIANDLKRTSLYVPQIDRRAGLPLIFTLDGQSGSQVLLDNVGWLPAATVPLPVKISVPVESYYSSIMDALNSSHSAETMLEVRACTLNGDQLFNQDINVTIKGGYNANFNAIEGYTVIDGTLTIKNGKLAVKNLVLR